MAAPSPAPWPQGHLDPTLAWGCFSQRDAVVETCTPPPAAVTAQTATWSPVAPQPSLTAEPSPTHHTGVPQPRRITPNPTACSCTGGFGAGLLGIIPASPGKRGGWTIHEVPLSLSLMVLWLQGGCGQIISSGSCSPAVWCVAPSWPSRKTLGKFSTTATLLRAQASGTPSPSRCAWIQHTAGISSPCASANQPSSHCKSPL